MSRKRREARRPAPAPPTPPRRAFRLEPLVFAALVVATLAPIWLVPYFPSQDGGSHLETASVFLRYADPLYSKYYELNLSVGPNWVVTLLLGGLMLVFSPAVAEKILVSGYVVLFALSARLALGAIRAESRWLAPAALLLVFNLPLHMGFYNFCLSLGLLLLVVGYYLRRHPRWTIPSTAALAALAVLLYLCHPVSLVMAAAFIGILSVWPWPVPPWRQPRASLAPLVALAPAVALLATFVTREGSDLSGGRSRREVRLTDFLFLRAYDDFERWLCYGVFAVFGLAVAYRLVTLRRQPEQARWASLAFVVLVLTGIYAAVPDMLAGGTMVKMRLTIYPFLGLLLWLGAGVYARWFRGLLLAAIVALLAVQLGHFTGRYRAINERLAVYYSAAEHLPAGATLLPLCFDPWGSAGDRPLSVFAQPFLHAAGRISAAKRALTLLNQPGNTDYYPVALRPSNNPYAFITPDEKNYHRGRPPEFLSYAERTGGSVDYVLVWGLRRSLLQSPSVKRILEQLSAGYEEIDRSADGHMVFFKRKG
jgi:hypothetical protein